MVRTSGDNGWGPFPPLLPSPQRIGLLLIVKAGAGLEAVGAIASSLAGLKLEELDGKLDITKQAINDRLEAVLRGEVAAEPSEVEQDLAYDPASEPELGNLPPGVTDLAAWKQAAAGR